MQVFEFHFNPKTKEDLIFDSFCYEPENIYEKRLGSLYMLGFLKNALPQNVRFLDSLAKTIKENYYKSISTSPEKSFKESLKKTNEYLEKIAKGGDVSWLGNLSFGVIALTPQQIQSGKELNFTKVGDLKIFLIRKGQIIDVDQNLKFDDIEPYPLKIFGNIVSGKLIENDLILVLTEETSTTFLQEKLLTEIANILPFDQKKLRGALNAKREQLSKISGICLLIVLTKETLAKEKEAFVEKRPLMVFSLKRVFAPLINFFVKLRNSLLVKISSFLSIFRVPKLRIPKPKIPKLKIPRPKVPQIKLSFPKLPTRPKLPPKPKFEIKSFFLGKKIVLILFLFFFLALGFFIFEKKEEAELKAYQGQLSEIRGKVDQAESYLIIAETNPQAKKNANSLFRESWEEISPLVKIASTFPSDFTDQVLSLEDKISNNLFQLNKLIEVSEPKLFFEFAPHQRDIGGGYIPQKMIVFKEKLYFFNPYSENIFEVNNENQGKLIEIDKKFSLAIPFGDSILFFSKPDQLNVFKDGQFKETVTLETLDFSLDDFSFYKSNIYFLDKKSAEIIKYPYLEWNSPQLWLNSKTKKVTEAKSMAIDGSIWILTKNNSIERYYVGVFQETLKLDIFPVPESFSKIFTSFQFLYLYLLEPAQKRIIVLDKNAQVIKQFQSEKFDKLLDLTVSEDGKTIYLLNGEKVYQIKL